MVLFALTYPRFISNCCFLFICIVGFTFNYRENDLTKATRCYDICRYDRVYLRSQGETWRAKSIDIIGKDPIQLPSDAPLPTLKGITVPQLWPSDHFGLHAVLTKT